VVAGGVARPEVLFRGRAELGDPSGRVRRNVYHAARALEPAAAAALVEAAERIAVERAAAALERTVRDAADEGAVRRSNRAAHTVLHTQQEPLFRRAVARSRFAQCAESSPRHESPAQTAIREWGRTGYYANQSEYGAIDAPQLTL
jgi:hypothetical protein